MDGMHEAGGTWFSFPDFRGGNPYQTLLHDALPPGWRAACAPIESALADSAPGGRVFHLHMEEWAYRGEGGEDAALTRAAGFVSVLNAFRARGGRFVWTLHNELPHECANPGLHRAFQQRLAPLADVAHGHSARACALLRELGARPEAVLRAPHPGYAGHFPEGASEAEARRYLGLDADDVVVAFLGLVRRYKGLDALAGAFAEAQEAESRLRLVIAGRGQEERPARYDVPAPGVRMLSRFIADAELQYVLGAADIVVLPYTRSLTSGAAMLAMSFARPVLVPAHPGLLDQVRDGVDGFTYDAGAPGALAAALLRAAREAPRLRGPMRQAAREAALAYRFADLARDLLAAVRAPARETYP